MGQFWALAVIAPIIAGAFAYLFKLFETADSMRKQIAECAIWNKDIFPTGVSDIQGSDDWNILVGSYYLAVESIYAIILRASIGALGIFILSVLTIVASDYLAMFPLRGNISALALVQVLLLFLASMYALRVIFVVNRKSALKGKVDMAVARCKARLLEADKKDAKKKGTSEHNLYLKIENLTVLDRPTIK